MCNAKADASPYNLPDFLKRKNIFHPYICNSIWHAILTAQVTSICDRNTQVSNISSILIQHTAYQPFPKPQFGKVIVRSLLDRTLFVLGRAAAVAAPAGAVIWILANVTVDGSSLLSYCTGALDPFAKLLGMDGVILMAFILGLPANEIVIPIIIMCYMSQGSLTELSLPALAQLLGENGWTCAQRYALCCFRSCTGRARPRC